VQPLGPVGVVAGPVRLHGHGETLQRVWPAGTVQPEGATSPGRRRGVRPRAHPQVLVCVKARPPGAESVHSRRTSPESGADGEDEEVRIDDRRGSGAVTDPRCSIAVCSSRGLVRPGDGGDHLDGTAGSPNGPLAGCCPTNAWPGATTAPPSP
jgi:hypothetical protein